LVFLTLRNLAEIGEAFQRLGDLCGFFLAGPDPSANFPLVNVAEGTITVETLWFFQFVFCAVSLAPGAIGLSETFFVLNPGFQIGFGLSDDSAVYMTIISMIGAMCVPLALSFAFSRQMYALGRVGMFPRVLARTHPRTGTSWVASLTGCCISYALCLLCLLSDNVPMYQTIVFNMAMFVSANLLFFCHFI